MYFRSKPLTLPRQVRDHELVVKVEGSRVTAAYGQPENRGRDLSVALLKNSVVSRITAGENAGRTLKHDYVAIHAATHRSSSSRWSLNLPADKVRQADAIAVWVGLPATHLQAVGGLLDKGETPGSR